MKRILLIQLTLERLNMIKGKLSKEDGSMLVMAVVFSFITVLLGLAFLTTVARMETIVDQEVANVMATYDCFAGNLAGVADNSLGTPHDGQWFGYYDENQYSYKTIPAGQQDINYGVSSTLRVVGSGRATYLDVTSDQVVESQFDVQSYADFLYLSDKERDVKDSIIYFYTPDTLDGLVHSNDTIHIQASADFPRFKKLVTTTANRILPRSNHARFDEKWHYRKKITFPDQATEIRRYNGVLGPNGQPLGTFDPDSITQIVFTDGGRFYVRYCGPDPTRLDSIKCSPNHIDDSPARPLPRTGCFFIYGKVWMSAARGRHDLMDGPYPTRANPDPNRTFTSNGFEGQLTVATSDTLLITDDLVYKHARADYTVPASMDSCPDILGLISEDFIMFGKKVNSTVHVNAAMAAIRGSISVEDIYDYYHTNWKQSLFIYGSLAQRNRGKVHTGEINNERGFKEKDYHYDWRLRENPPPHFLEVQGKKLQFIDSSNNNIVGGNG
jgi:hypothetical protein